MEAHKTSIVVFILIIIFAIIHSGGAALRNKAELLIGPRLWRLVFVSLSLPSAIILIGYFLAHRYDGSTVAQKVGDQYVADTWEVKAALERAGVQPQSAGA